MKRTRHTREKNHEKPIRTTFWELIDELSGMTKDDNLVVAAVRSIFHNYGVRFGHSLAPVKLVGGAVAPRARLKVRHG